MPSISLTLPLSGTQITASLHATNYSNLQTLLNGGLDNTNLSVSAAIAPSKLAGYPTDAAKALKGDGSWTQPPGYSFDYKEFTGTNTVTATSEATATAVVTADAVTFDGSTTVWVEFFAPIVQPDSVAGRAVSFVLYDGSTSLGFLGAVATPAATGFLDVPVFARRRLTPAAAAKTYSVRAFVNGGTALVEGQAGGAGLYMPGYISITKA